MKNEGYNPQQLTPEELAKMPIGARLLRDEEERNAFEKEFGGKDDLYVYTHYARWDSGWNGGSERLTYCTTRPLGWDKPSEHPALYVPGMAPLTDEIEKGLENHSASAKFIIMTAHARALEIELLGNGTEQSGEAR